MTFPNKEFHYQNTGASVCAGTVGYGISILDACLVTGFNSKNVSSITVTANVATLTTATAHGFVLDEIILIAGANEAVFNTEFKVASVPTTTTLTFAVTTATTPATGTITVKFAPLGWEKVYSGTNKAVYRSQDVTGTRLYLRVDDSNAQYMTVNMYEAMSNVDTGTGASTTLYWKKSDASSTAARPWYLIGNSKTFYWFTEWSASFLLQSAGYAFGDVISCKAGDAYNCILNGHSGSDPGIVGYMTSFSQINHPSYSEGNVISRSHTQLGSSLLFYKRAAASGTVMGYDNDTAYPNPPDNGVHLCPVYLYEVNHAYRGIMPGLYVSFERNRGVFLSRDKSVMASGNRFIAYKIDAHAATIPVNLWFALDTAWT